MIVFFFFVFGAIVASFIGVLTERLNTGTSWMRGRSRCDSCATVLRSIELIPLVSWSISFGRCRSCGSRVSYRSTLAEGTLGVLFAVAYLQLGFSVALIFFLLTLIFLLAVVLYDLRHMLVPRAFYLPFVVSAFAFALSTATSLHSFGLTLLAAAAIGLAFFLLSVLSGGKWMGLGDAPIAFGLSLLSGAAALSGLIFSFWIGAVIGIVLLVLTPRTRRMGIEVPFVPFLAAGFLLAYFTSWDPFLIVAALLNA